MRCFPLFLILLAGLAACEQDYTPKPRGFFRIDLPEKEYARFDTTWPYAFDYPVYAVISPDTRPSSEPWWMNIDFPMYKARIHVSYKTIDDNLPEYLENTRTFVIKHIPKAEAIIDTLIYNPDRRVFGMIYYIEGSGAASPCQFFVTDSARHFLRGALYFNIPPNNDSLAPVIRFIEADIRQMISGFEWK